MSYLKPGGPGGIGGVLSGGSGSRGLTGLLDPGGFFGDGEDGPTPLEKYQASHPAPRYGQWSNDQLLGAYQKDTGTAGLLAALGRGTGAAGNRVNQETSVLSRRGVAPGGVTGGSDVAGGIDWNGVFSLTDAEQYIRAAARAAGERALRHGGNFDQAVNNTATRLREQLKGKLAENTLRRDEKAWGDQYAPVYDAAASRLSELAGTADVNAAHEQELRAKIAGQVSQAKLSNLSQVGAALGLRGVANSPAAAALAAREGERYDAELTSQLRDMGIQVDEANRNQARADVAATTQLAQMRQNSRQAYLAHDVTNVDKIGNDTQELIASLYNRDQTFKLMQQQIDSGGGGGGSAAGAVSGAASGAMTGASFGPWGALAGGVIGAAGGYFGGGSGVGSGAMQAYGSLGGGGAYGSGNGYGGTVNRYQWPAQDANGNLYS